MTYRLKYLLVLLSFLMFGCDEELNVLEGPDAQNWAFHGTRDSLNSVALEFSVNNIDSIALKSIAVAVVDDSLNVLRTRTVKKGSLKNDSIYVPADDYESPYVRLTYVGVMPNRDSISLVFYFDINESKSYRVNVVDAFMQYRIEDLVAQENYTLRIAKKIALSDLQDFLSDELELFPDKSVFYSEEWIQYSCGYFRTTIPSQRNLMNLPRPLHRPLPGKRLTIAWIPLWWPTIWCKTLATSITANLLCNVPMNTPNATRKRKGIRSITRWKAACTFQDRFIANREIMC